MGASSPIPSDQSTQTLSVKLLRKAASFTSEGARFNYGSARASLSRSVCADLAHGLEKKLSEKQGLLLADCRQPLPWDCFRVVRDSPKVSGSATEFPFPQWSRRFGCFSKLVLLGPRNPRLHAGELSFVRRARPGPKGGLAWADSVGLAHLENERWQSGWSN